jgi:hypothetical protein
LGNARRSSYTNVVASPEHQESLAKAYEAAPEFDHEAVPAFRALREETSRQFEHLTRSRSRGGLGIDVSVTPHDPYANAGAMHSDVNNNSHLAVLSTTSTGGHPFFSNDENDQFRAVHDAFGHMATNRSFDRHGEEAAYQSHATMFTPLASQALATETRGQNAHLIRRGSFAAQKIALLPGSTADAPRLQPVQARQLLTQSRQFHGMSGLPQ